MVYRESKPIYILQNSNWIAALLVEQEDGGQCKILNVNLYNLSSRSSNIFSMFKL